MSIFAPTQRANYMSTYNNNYPPSFYSRHFNNCNNTLCYTYNNKTIYKPHTGYGMVGTTAAAYLASRKRL